MRETIAPEGTSVRRYFDDIADSKPLSRERELSLSARIKDGDMAARDEPVWANLRFVVDVATNFQHRGLSLLELVSAGNLGLLIAAEHFDGGRGVKFISYAVWWIKQSILLTLTRQPQRARGEYSPTLFRDTVQCGAEPGTDWRFDGPVARTDTPDQKRGTCQTPTSCARAAFEGPD